MANLLSTTVNGALNSTGRITASYDTDRYQMNFNRASASNWWVTNDAGNLGFHLNNVGDRFYFGTGGDFWSSANGWLSTALAGKLSTGGTAANSSQLEGYSAYGLVVEARGAHSGSDFPNGTLVQTDINADGWAGDSFVMEVSGKSYGSGTPFKLIMEGYLYADTIINVSAMSYGSYFPAPVKVMRYNGNVAFWWPRGSYWNSFLVHVRNANGESWNRVTSITDSVDPASADKKISITPVQVIHTNNIGSQSVSYAASSGAVTHSSGRTDSSWYNAIWGAGTPSLLYSCDAVRIQSSTGAVRANIFYDNQDTGYYVDPNSASYLSTLRIADAVNGVSLSVGNGSTHGVYTADNARKYLVVAADYYPHMALVASGANNTDHGPVFSFVGSEGGNFRQWNLGISNNNPFLFSIGYNNSGDANPHYGVGDAWSGNDAHHARLSIDRNGNTKIRGMLYVNGTSGGISTGSAVIHAGNIGSQSVSVARQLLSPNDATVVAADSAMPSAGHSFIHTLALGPGGNDGHILGMTWAGTTSIYGAQIFIDTDPNDIMAIRSRSNAGVWTSWKTVIHSGNIASQSVNYATSAGSASTASVAEFQSIPDYRGNAFAPNDYTGNRIWWHFNNKDTVGGYGTYWHAIQTVSPWSSYDPTHRQQQIQWGGTDISFRYATSGTTWSSWFRFITDANIASQSVSYADESGYSGSTGSVEWTNVNSRPTALSQFTNNLGNYGNWITTDGRAYPRRSDGTSINFYWDGQGGQPTWLWGSNNGVDFYVWNPSNFSVNYATSAGSADNIDGWGFVNTGSNNATNADTIDSNGISYYDSGVTNFSGNATDGALYSQRYSGSWQHQIAGDYRSGMIAVRGRNNGTWTSWRTVIDSGNIGSQSVNYATSAGSVPGGLTTSNYASTLDGRYFFDFGFTIGYPGTDANNMPGNRSAFTYSNGAPYTGPIAHFGAAGYGLQLNANYGTGTSLGFRVRNGDNGTWNAWREIIHSGNIASQSVNYADESGYSASSGSVEWTNVQNKPATFPPSTHNHDDRYYTESESDGRFQPLENQRLSTGNSVTFTNVYNNAWFRNNNVNEGLYNQATGTHFYSNSVEGWAITGSGANILLEFRSNHQSTLRGYVHANTSNQIGFLNNGGSWTLRTDSSKNAFIHGTDLTINADNAGSSNIFMNDGDEGMRQIHCNSNRIGFLTQGGSWGSWCNDDGSWSTAGGLSVAGNTSWFGGYGGGSGPGLALENQNTFARFAFFGLDFYDWDHGIQMEMNGNYVYVNNYLQAGNSLRAPIFYDSNDTGYYLDPNGTSNLLQLNTSTRARWGKPRLWTDRSAYSSDEGYWTGTNGWSTGLGTWANAWQGGFSGWDIWGTGTDHPQGGGYVHAQGIVSGQHYATSSVGYGWMMVGAHNATENRYWLRGKWDTSTSGWTEVMTSNQNPIAWNMDQYVRTSDSVSFNSTTSPTFLVNNQSDNTKGYRIYNTSNASVSAMFTNSANALVIGAGAFDQVQLNKKVLVSGAALGVNVAASATAGRIDASNDIVAYSSSDERLKHNITPIENALDKVKSLTGVEFDWKPEYKHAHGYEGHDTGIIAQQVQEVIPSAVRTNDTGFLAVRYEKLIGLLIEANKELAARVEELEKKLG
jgi:hypothetical protein